MNTQNQIFTVNKFVEAMKAKYPGAKKFAIIVNIMYANKTKFNYITNPLAVYVEKERLDIDELCHILDIEQFTFSINQGQYNYMSSRKSYVYWSIVIDNEAKTKTIDGEEHEYYPSSLFFIKDQKLIESLLPKPQEFNLDDYF